MKKIINKFRVQKDGKTSTIDVYEKEKHWFDSLSGFFNHIYKVLDHYDDLSYNLEKWNKTNYHKLSKDELLNLKELDLSNLYLKKIPIEIGYLQNLEILNLAGNELEYLPDEIYGLINLKELNLGNIMNGGNNIKYISPNIDRLQNLQSLHLIWNDNLHSLPKEISNLKNISYFSLSQEDIYHSKVVKDMNVFCIDFEEYRL